MYNLRNTEPDGDPDGNTYRYAYSHTNSYANRITHWYAGRWQISSYKWCYRGSREGGQDQAHRGSYIDRAGNADRYRNDRFGWQLFNKRI